MMSQYDLRENMVTVEAIAAAPENIRPVRIEITFADGHQLVSEGEGARAFYRKMCNGELLDKES
jgi:hypothetical protein